MHFQSIHFNFWDEKLVSKLTQELLKVKTCSPKKNSPFPNTHKTLKKLFELHIPLYTKTMLESLG